MRKIGLAVRVKWKRNQENYLVKLFRRRKPTSNDNNHEGMLKRKRKCDMRFKTATRCILSNAWPKTMVPDFHDIINLITYDWFLDLFASLSRTTVKPNAKQSPRLQVRKNPRMVWIEINFFIEPVSRGWQLKRSQDWSRLLNRDCLLQSSFKNCLRFYFF